MARRGKTVMKGSSIPFLLGLLLTSLLSLAYVPSDAHIGGGLLLVSQDRSTFGSAAGDANNSDDSDESTYLRVTVGRTGLREVPSASHSYGSIELVNTHPSQTLKIQSMEARPVNDEPVQITVSEFANRVLTLGPGQTAVLPVSFYPVIPSDFVEDQLYGGPLGSWSREGGGPFDPFEEQQSKRRHPTITVNGVELPASRVSRAVAIDLAELVGRQRYENYMYGQHWDGADHGGSIAGGSGSGSDRGDGDGDGTATRARVEWKRLIDLDPSLEESIRSNPRLHIVLANLYIDMETSGSTLVTPVVATAVRTNSHGLPSTLTFHPDIATMASDRSFDGTNEFDLYMFNPYKDRDVHVVDVYSSNPMAVKIEPTLPTLDNVPEGAYFASPVERRGNLHDVEKLIRREKAFGRPWIWEREWMVDGPVVLRPGEGGYVGTVRILDVDLGPSDDDVANFVGYVHVRTSTDNLVVAVESAPKEKNRGDGSADGSGSVILEKKILDSHSGNKNFENGKVEKEDGKGIGGDSARNERSLGNASRGGVDGSVATSADATRTDADEKIIQKAVLSANPSNIHFGLLTSPISQFSTVSINVTNRGAEILRLMRVTVGVNMQEEGEDQTTPSQFQEDYGLSVQVHIQGDAQNGGGTSVGANTPSGGGDVVILPGETVVGAVVVTCRPTPKQVNSRQPHGGHETNQQPREYIGSVVIRAGMATLPSYADWEEEIVREPFGASSNHALLEIPFRADVFDGFIKYNIQNGYFPVGLAADTASGGIIGKRAKRLDQTIKIRNGFPFVVMLRTFRVVGIIVSTSAVTNRMLDEKSTTICRTLYSVIAVGKSGLNGEKEVLVQPESIWAEPDGEFGDIIVRYDRGNGAHIAKGGDRSRHRNETSPTGSQVESQECGIAVEMLFGSYPPVEFVVPLNQFDGRIVARLDHRYLETTDVRFLSCHRRRNTDISRNVNGCLARWYQNTIEGKALEAHIETTEGAERRQQRQTHTPRGHGGGDAEDKGTVDRLLEYLTQRNDDNSPDLAPDLSKVDPIVLSLGTVPPSSVRSYSLFFTNPNPIPINVRPDHGGCVEGLSIELGTVESNALDLFGIRAEQQPNLCSGVEDKQLRRFLSSLEPSQSLFGRLSQLNDIRPATLADSVLITDSLTELYFRHASASIHRLSSSLSQTTLDNPLRHSCFEGGVLPADAALDGRETKSSWFGRQKQNNRHNGDRAAAGLLLGSDGTRCYVSPAAALSPSAIPSNISWDLPPSSTARFDLTVRTPPRSVLLNRSHSDKIDITSFVSTGLVLRTSLGQVLPIVLTYQTLLGELIASTERSVEWNATGYNNGKLEEESGGASAMSAYRGTKERNVSDGTGMGEMERIYVPATLLPPLGYLESFYGSIFAGKGNRERSVPLFIRSTFGGSLEILRVESCSPWFDVVLHGNQTSSKRLFATSAKKDLGIFVGVARSSIRCQRSTFYSCASVFLESRSAVQPTGCGLAEDISAGENSWIRDVSKQAIKSRAISALRLADERLDAMYKENAVNFRPRVARASFLTPSEVRPFADARMAWHKVKSNGLHFVRGGFRVIAEHETLGSEYDDDDDDEATKSRLSISLPRSLLWSALEIPTLFDPPIFCDDKSKYESCWTGSPGLPYPGSINATKYRFDSAGAGIVEFPTTLLSDVAIAFVPVHNPSGVPVKLRLAPFSLPSTGGRGPNGSSAEIDPIEWLIGMSDEEIGSDCQHVYAPPYVHSCQPTTSATSAVAGAGASSSAAAPPGSAGTNPWWTGGAYYKSSGGGTLLRSKHNVTIKSMGGAHIALVNPSLHATSSLVAGCGGRRCGLRDGQQFQAQPGQQLSQQQQAHNSAQLALLTTPERLFSSMGASVARDERLRGRLYDSQSGQETLQSVEEGEGGPDFPLKWSNQFSQPFAITSNSVQEVMLSPGHKKFLGPIYFRPPARSTFVTTFFIENSLTGAEPFKVKGNGGIHQAAFVEAVQSDFDTIDDGVTEQSCDSNYRTTSHLENRFGLPALMFSGRGPERATSTSSSIGGGTEVLRKVKVQNTGDVTIEFNSVYMAPNPVARFSHRKLHPLGLGILKAAIVADEKNYADARRNDNMQACSIGSFRLVGCIDPDGSRESNSVYVKYRSALTLCIAAILRWTSFRPPKKKAATIQGSETHNLREGFSLKPNESKVLTIEHTPDCFLRSSFVALNLEYSTENPGGTTGLDAFGAENNKHFSGKREVPLLQQSKKEKLLLLVGYDMSTNVDASCVSHGSVIFSAAHVMAQSLKSLGLESLRSHTRSKRKDSKNDSAISKPSVIMLSVWSVLFLAVFFACILELILRVHDRVRSASTSAARVVLFSHNESCLHTSLPDYANESESSMASKATILTTIGWKRVYRCLAGSDLNAADLTQIGREQTRQFLLGKYKKIGTVMPQCLRSSGAFARDGAFSSSASSSSSGGGKETAQVAASSSVEGNRDNTSSGPSSASKGGVSTPSGRRAHAITLSDAIFGQLETDHLCPFSSSSSSSSSSIAGQSVPIGLGWRDAAARGIIPRTVRPKPADGNRVGILLNRRAELREHDFTNVAVAHAVAIFDNELDLNEERKNTTMEDEDEKEDDIASLLPQPPNKAKAAPVPPTKKKHHSQQEARGGAENSTVGKGGRSIKPQSNYAVTETWKPLTKKSAGNANIGRAVNPPLANSSAALERTHFIVASSRGEARHGETVNAKESKVKSSGKTVVAKANIIPSLTKDGRWDDVPMNQAQDKNSSVSATATMDGSRRRSRQQQAHQRAWRQLQSGKAGMTSDSHRDGRMPNAPAITSHAGDSHPSSPGTTTMSPVDSARYAGDNASLPTLPSLLTNSKAFAPICANGASRTSPIPATMPPPPGLAPPPGFSLSKRGAKLPGFEEEMTKLPNLGENHGKAELNSSDSQWPSGTLAPTSDEAIFTSQQDSSRSLLATLREEQYGSSQLSLGNELPMTSSVSTNRDTVLSDPSSPGILESKPLLGLGGGFNVMNFLDTILDDSGMIEDDPKAEACFGADEDLSVQSARSDICTDGIVETAAPALHVEGSNADLVASPGTAQESFGAIRVSSDPWAAATNGPTITDSSGRIVSTAVPLLTPATIINRRTGASSSEGTGVDGDSSENKDHDYFARNPFLESLIGGSEEEE